MRTTICRSCTAKLKWVRLTSGASMPLDPGPHPDGNVLLLGDGYRAAVLTRDEIDALPPTVPLYRSHFATCPHAESHRRA